MLLASRWRTERMATMRGDCVRARSGKYHKVAGVGERFQIMTVCGLVYDERDAGVERLVTEVTCKNCLRKTTTLPKALRWHARTALAFAGVLAVAALGGGA